MMKFNKIIRILEQPRGADKSAVAAINRALRFTRKDTVGEVKNDAHSELAFVELQA
jgi:hypothetical protein